MHSSNQWTSYLSYSWCRCQRKLIIPKKIYVSQGTCQFVLTCMMFIKKSCMIFILTCLMFHCTFRQRVRFRRWVWRPATLFASTWLSTSSRKNDVSTAGLKGRQTEIDGKHFLKLVLVYVYVCCKLLKNKLLNYWIVGNFVNFLCTDLRL
jgi:hypothetical protein